MDWFLYSFENIANFCVASIPLVLVALLLKFSKLSPKLIGICISLNLLVSVFFWLKLRDFYVALYQSVPYVSSFIWVWANGFLRKRRKSENGNKT